MAVFKVIQNTFGQAEFRDAVPQHAADFIVAFKNGHIIAIARQNDAMVRPAGPEPMMAAFLPLEGTGP